VAAGWSADRPQWQVRIRQKPDEPPVGAGMLCNDAHVVTCAHVISPGESKPTEPVFVEFQFVNPHDPIPAVVVDDGWHPARGDGSGDIAVLKLQGSLPSGVRSAPMSDTKGIKSHSFRAYGYPRGHELDGVWSEDPSSGMRKLSGSNLKLRAILDICSKKASVVHQSGMISSTGLWASSSPVTEIRTPGPGSAFP
jgi:hypothetical protein